MVLRKLFENYTLFIVSFGDIGEGFRCSGALFPTVSNWCGRDWSAGDFEPSLSVAPMAIIAFRTVW
jgi:hypothetical protein